MLGYSGRFLFYMYTVAQNLTVRAKSVSNAGTSANCVMMATCIVFLDRVENVQIHAILYAPNSTSCFSIRISDQRRVICINLRIFDQNR